MSAPMIDTLALRTVAAGAASAAIVLAACSADSLAPRAAPVIASAAVTANVHNTLSASVTFRVTNADSARVLARALSASGTPDSSPLLVTPFEPIVGVEHTMVLLGLRPSTDYALTLQVEGTGPVTQGLSFTSGVLPAPLAGLALHGVGVPTTGYTLTDFTAATAAYAVAFDSSGQLAWYREFPTLPGESALDAEQQANGDYILFVGASTGWQPTSGKYYEVTPAGETVRTLAAATPYYTDPHELRLDFNGPTLVRSHLLEYDLRTIDLSSIGGRAAQLVAGHELIRRDASGKVEFRWNAWDHFAISDWLFVQPGLSNMTSIDFDHPNSIDRDASGNYIISFASLGEITCIDGTSGEMLWRFGGRHNQFTIIGDPLGGFGIQHDVRLLPNGDLLLMDNGVGHSPPESRAVEYKLDLAAHTATMVWQYRHTPRLFAPFAGSVQRLASGNTVVAFGASAHVAEVTSAGQPVWEADLLNLNQRVPFLYRARRIASLY